MDSGWPERLAELDLEVLARCVGELLATHPDAAVWSDTRLLTFLRSQREKATGAIEPVAQAEELERSGLEMLARLRAKGRID